MVKQQIQIIEGVCVLLREDAYVVTLPAAPRPEDELISWAKWAQEICEESPSLARKAVKLGEARCLSQLINAAEALIKDVAVLAHRRWAWDVWWGRCPQPRLGLGTEEGAAAEAVAEFRRRLGDVAEMARKDYRPWPVSFPIPN